MEKNTIDIITEYEQQDPRAVIESEGKQIIFATPNRHTAWRVQTLYSKEPDTIEWISSFQPNEILLDIGANVGMYTIFSAKSRGVKVYAFEPESQNYAILNKNIFLNQLGEQVTAYCLALSDNIGFSKLYLSQFIVGGSCHNYGEALNFKYEPLNSPFSQGCFSSTVDELVKTGVMPIPHYIKIDVDGIEPKVIKGAQQTLLNPQVKSVLIEINTALDDHWEIIDFMLAAGFNYSQEQVNQAVRAEGAFQGVGNYVFRR